jgi:regulator of sirC expression with transglutaminase-like and TPR domain
MLLVRPGEAETYRDRGLIAARLNRLREASFDLQRYLYLAPTAPDATQLKQHLDMMEEKLSRLN